MPFATVAMRRRPGGRRDLFRAYRIVIDGTTVGKIKRGQSHEIKVPPGSHAVMVAIDWGSSPVAHVELGPGERAAFVCEPGGPPETGLATGIFDRHAYLALNWDV